MIQYYSFGKIIIDNKTYKKDLIILKKRIMDNWWREKGHYLQLKDMYDIMNSNPEIIIIGTGFFGLMKVSKEITGEFNRNKIQYYIEKSGKAVKLFNELISRFPEKNISAAFHLTC